MHPIGMVRIHHFEFVCRSMHIKPTVNHFRVFYQMHCSQGFYSFAQRAPAQKILLNPPMSFHEWKPKFFFIKARVIPMKITFRGKDDIVQETIQTPLSETWYQDLKDVPSIELPERALVAAGMSLFWRMEREDKPVYMEGDTTVNIALKKTDTAKSQSSKVKNVKGEKKGTRHSSDSWCDYVVVSDSLEGLVPVVGRKPKAEPRDIADIPALNPEYPIDLELSPEPLLKTKAGKRKHVEIEAEAQPAKKVQRRKINKRGNLDAFIVKPPPGDYLFIFTFYACYMFVIWIFASVEKPVSRVHAEPSSAVNIAEAENPEVEKPVEVESGKVVDPKTVDVDAGYPTSPEVVACDPEKGKSAQEDPVTTFHTSASAPVNIERSPAGDHGAFDHDEENDPFRLDETLGDYYYITYSENKASEIHTPVWNLKKGDTFSNWRVCRDWLQGTFPLTEIKFQEDRAYEQAYHAYREEAASYTSTTHRIVREWHNMHKEWAAFEASKKKVSEDEARVALLRATLEADRAKFESVQKTEEWSVARWKRKAEVERLKKKKADVEAARDEGRSHRERSEQRGVRTCATLDLKDKEIDELTALLSEQEQIRAELESAKKDLQLEWVEKAETSCRLVETEEKLESSETARVTVESQVEPLKNDMLWLKDRGIISVATVLNSNELDETVAHLLVAARSDEYAQGHTECTQQVVTTLKVDWDTSRSATHGVDIDAALATAKAQYNTLQLLVMDLVTVTLQSEDFVTRLREVFPDREDDDDEDLD
ncbi:hypothetical protein Hanom_Chr12g01141961 [Helianthus anomalus]